ncbi:hypothetical protein THAOC_22833, partial [Thalassiosira oceanica]
SSSSGPWRRRPAENRSRGAPYPLEIFIARQNAAVVPSVVAVSPPRVERRPDDGGLALAASAAAVISPGEDEGRGGGGRHPSLVHRTRPGGVTAHRSRCAAPSWSRPFGALVLLAPAASNLGPVLRAAPTSSSASAPPAPWMTLGGWGPNGPLLSANKVGHVWTSKRVAFCEPQNWSLKLPGYGDGSPVPKALGPQGPKLGGRRPLPGRPAHRRIWSMGRPPPGSATRTRATGGPSPNGRGGPDLIVTGRGGLDV